MPVRPHQAHPSPIRSRRALAVGLPPMALQMPCFAASARWTRTQRRTRGIGSQRFRESVEMFSLFFRDGKTWRILRPLRCFGGVAPATPKPEVRRRGSNAPQINEFRRPAPPVLLQPRSLFLSAIATRTGFLREFSVFIMPAHPKTLFVAAQRRAVEPLIHAPQAVQSA